MYNISKNATRINGELWGESWPTPRFRSKKSLSLLLLITVMDVIWEEVGRGPPHAMLFTDDLVICENTGEQAEEVLWQESTRQAQA